MVHTPRSQGGEATDGVATHEPDEDSAPEILNEESDQKQVETRNTNVRNTPAGQIIVQGVSDTGQSEEATKKDAFPNDTDTLDIHHDSDSEESVVSDTETVISVASSITLVNEDAVEIIFRRLQLFGSLRYLWPQLINRLGSRTRCIRAIEKVLRRWSEDLGLFASSFDSKSPDRMICFSACRIVRKSRLNIAKRIWEAHHQVDEHRLGDGLQTAYDIEGPMEDKGDPEDDDHFAYDVAERFLFDTEPIYSLQSRVKGIIESHNREPENFTSRLYRLAEVHFTNTMTTVFESPVPPGKKRLWWKCVRDNSLILSPCFSSLYERLVSRYICTLSCHVLEQNEQKPDSMWLT